ncbi:MAG: UDP-N-acetylmuramate--L-alanine ligase [Thermomicrobiales bacterium]|nr:UDP-N-acetylmuramate--L-alanine ligase [Thermomicrobiales bacterium]
MTDRTPETLPPPPATLHFIGIGGIGMSALARILSIWGYTVTGSDANESTQTQALRAMGIPVIIGHDDPSLASHADIVVTNKRAAANASIELDAAIANSARIIKRGDLLGMAAAEKYGIAVAGSHGKSTTSSMLSVALRTLDADPTFAVGAIIAATGTNAEPGAGPHFVVEADEFDRSFHGLFPNVAIVTSVAFDHPDIYADQEEYDQSFVEFVNNIRTNGTLIIASDDPGCQRVLANLHRLDIIIRTFGEDDGAHWRLSGDASHRIVRDPEGNEHAFQPKMPGKHNARNAVAAIAALHAAGFSVEDAIRGVESFTGLGRRFEHKGEINGVSIIDDYAHHPEEITEVLRAAREHFVGKRLIVVHQPHTYSRTHSLMDEFAASLDLADDVVLMEIYGVGEANPYNISSADLAARMRKSVSLAVTPEAAADIVRQLLGDDTHAVVFTIGAGTVTQVGPLLVASA